MFTPKIIGLFFLTAIVANTMYMGQKYTVPYSPAFVYMVSFLFAGVVSGLYRYFLDQGIYTQTGFHWTMLTLGISTLLLNVSFNLLYTQDMPMIYVPLIVTGCVAIVGPIFAYVVFGETISMSFVLGTAMVLGGMAVMVK